MNNGKHVSIYLRGEWVAAMTDTLARLHPELDRDAIEDMVIDEFNQSYADHECAIHNSYEDEVARCTLGWLVDWIEKTKPIMSESGVFFYPKNERRNLNVEIIKEVMLDARNVHKKEMFAARDRGDMFTATVKELQQANDKKAANSGYGAEGQPSSFLFNINSAMSVTAAGRGQLSTAICCFENFLEDNVKFWDMDQFFIFVRNVIKEAPTWNFSSADYIDIIPTKDEWVERFIGKFLELSFANKDNIAAVYDSLTPEEQLRTYYKCNLRGFFLNRKPGKMYNDIMKVDVEFKNPNDPPKEIADNLKSLVDVTIEFVNYKYSQFRYEDRGAYMKRKAVVVNDTDSTLMTLMNVMAFMEREVLPLRIMPRKERKSYLVKLENVITSMCTRAITETLWNYLDYVHVAEEDRHHVAMKNEFAYDTFIVTMAKKSYIGLLTRRESLILPKPEIDVKGLNFFKSTSTKKTAAFIYELLDRELLQPADGKISLQRIYGAISDFQRAITDDITDGDIGYMKQSVKVKSRDAYATPMSIGAYKAVYTWNAIVDEKDQIKLPETVTMVKVKLRNRKDIAALTPWPKIYERMMKLFDENPEYGDHIEYDKNGKEKMVKGKGAKAIAVPSDYDELPEWIIPIIDVETLVNDNMALFEQINRALGFTKTRTTHLGNTLKYYANVVRI